MSKDIFAGSSPVSGTNRSILLLCSDLPKFDIGESNGSEKPLLFVACGVKGMCRASTSRLKQQGLTTEFSFLPDTAHDRVGMSAELQKNYGVSIRYSGGRQQ